jgi:hypothetical protein
LLEPATAVCPSNFHALENIVDLLLAIVVGNYLYIDGGEVYLNESGAVAAYAGSRPPFAYT